MPPLLALHGVLAGRRTQHRSFALIALCSAINSSECSLLFKHPVLPKPYLGGVFPQHMLEFTVSAATLQSTFGFSHPQTAVLIRRGFPSLSRGGQAQQFAFCREPRAAVAELIQPERGTEIPAWGRVGSAAQHSHGPQELGLARLSQRMPHVEKEEGEGVGVFILAGEVTEPQNH